MYINKSKYDVIIGELMFGRTYCSSPIRWKARSAAQGGTQGMGIMTAAAISWDAAQAVLSVITPHVVVHNDDADFISRRFLDRVEFVKRGMH